MSINTVLDIVETYRKFKMMGTWENDSVNRRITFWVVQPIFRFFKKYRQRKFINKYILFQDYIDHNMSLGILREYKLI